MRSTRPRPRSIAAPVALGVTGGCGEETTITVPLEGKRKAARKTIRLVTRTADGRPRRDRDRVRLICRRECRPAACDNPAGPDRLDLAVAASGTDLDNGWTGISMNFPTPENATVSMCMSDCNTTTDGVCALHGTTGACSLNGPVFGPPLPLLAANVPVCVVNRFDGPITGEFDMESGQTSLQVNLLAEVYFTDPGEVCPRCVGANAVGATGTCQGGARAGRPCTVASILHVAQSTAADKNFQLSRDCPPAAARPDGVLHLSLPLTTDTTAPVGDGGPVPCGQEPQNPKAVTARENDCGGAACNAECTGLACVARTPAGECIDSKGGISQLCCANRTTLPCHPTPITRTGARGVPQPAWPDPTYPKVGTGTMAAVFCEPATDNFLVNTSTGLPGPGAVLLPGTVTIHETGG